MTKKEIVKEIADRADLTQLQTKEIVQWTFDAIVETLCRERRIELRNFGVFEVKRREPRKARNPKTGAAVQVEAKNVVTFKPGKEMEEKVGRLPILPKGQKAAQRAKARVESDGNGTSAHEEALQTVGSSRGRKNS